MKREGIINNSPDRVMCPRFDLCDMNHRMCSQLMNREIGGYYCCKIHGFWKWDEKEGCVKESKYTLNTLIMGGIIFICGVILCLGTIIPH